MTPPSQNSNSPNTPTSNQTSSSFHDHDLGRTIFYVQSPVNNDTKIEPLIKPFQTYDHNFVSQTMYTFPSSLGAANGFMCMSAINGCYISLLPFNPIYVFNPITQETSQLPHYIVPKRDVPDLVDVEARKKIDKCVSGFGYNDISNEFMLVLVIFAATDYKHQIFHSEVQSLTLGCTSWKRKTDIHAPKCLRHATALVSPPVVSHRLHWITIDQSSFDGPLIVSYHMILEEFKFLANPPANLMLELPEEQYTLGVLEDHLYLAESSSSCTRIWVMNKYNARESWVKQFVVEHEWVCQPELSCDYVSLLKVCNNGELLLLCSNKYLVSYDCASGKCRFVEIEGVVKKDKLGLVAHPLVGRFISLKSAFGMDSSAKKITKKE